MDLGLGIGLILGGLTLFVGARRLPPGFAFDPLGPAGFPSLLAVTLIGSGLALVAQSIASGPQTAGPAPQEGVEATAQPESPPVTASRLLGVIGLSAAYVAVLQPAGFLISTPVYLAGLLWLQGRVPARDFLVTAIAFPVALFAVFQLLGVTLPLGLLEPLWYRLRYGGVL